MRKQRREKPPCSDMLMILTPTRDPDMISITSAPEAPAPRIRILDARQKEVETVRIGDRLTFRIEIPEKTPYGIFARSDGVIVVSYMLTME